MATIPTAKASLKALLEAWTWPISAPVVNWVGPTQISDIPRGGELIYFADTTDVIDRNARMGGPPAAFDVAFTLRLIIDVIQWGDDEQTTETRAWDLYAELVKLLRVNPTLGGATHRAGEERTARQQNIALTDQWLTRITVDQPLVTVVTNP